MRCGIGGGTLVAAVFLAGDNPFPILPWKLFLMSLLRSRLGLLYSK